MLCPNCNQKTTHVNAYNIDICKNIKCSFYMKDDIKNLKVSSTNRISTDQLIEDILNNFDFNKVNLVMKFLNWTWHDVGIPNINQLKESAKNLLQKCIKESTQNKTDFYTSTGGFQAFYSYDDNFLKLDFILESWDETDS